MFELSMSQPSFAAVILAAGSGTRMKSAMPKVMHPIAGRPMIAYPLEALRPLSPAATVVVIGSRMESVAEIVAPAECVVQAPPLGTGDAVRTAMRALDGRLRGSIEDVLVLYGDTPFLATETLSRLLTERRRTAAAILVSSMRPADPGPYGRFVLASDGGLKRIVEAAEAGPEGISASASASSARVLIPRSSSADSSTARQASPFRRATVTISVR